MHTRLVILTLLMLSPADESGVPWPVQLELAAVLARHAKMREERKEAVKPKK